MVRERPTGQEDYLSHSSCHNKTPLSDQLKQQTFLSLVPEAGKFKTKVSLDGHLITGVTERKSSGLSPSS